MLLDAQVLAFIGVAAVLTITPGADTLLAGRMRAVCARLAVRRRRAAITRLILIGFGVRLAMEQR